MESVKMDKESRPQLYGRELQKRMQDLENQLSALLTELAPVHADKAVEILEGLNRLRRGMLFS